MNWQLGIYTICSIWSDNIIAPILWSTLAIIAHVMGSVLLRFQIKRIDLSEVPRKLEFTLRGFPRSFGRILLEWSRTEFETAHCQRNIHLIGYGERHFIVIISWILSTLIVVHVIYGTIVLSSLYFIGPRDALMVIVRFIASVLACRIICMFEIAGLRENTKDIILECDVPENRIRYWPMAAQLESIKK